jgi:SNF2 family DNA or RNA helicase
MQKELPTLWAHQSEAVKRAGDHYALFFEPGTGKTATLITILRKLFTKEHKVIPTLILCPPVVISNWAAEINQWSRIPSTKVIMLTGKGTDRLKKIHEAPWPCIFITNYETLSMPVVFDELKMFLKSAPSALVLDESHKIKDISSKRSRLAIQLGDIAKYKYILTGTPVLRNFLDIFSQFRLMDGGQRFGTNFYTFRAKYFEDKNRSMPQDKYFPNWQPRPGIAEEIKKIIAPVSMVVEKSKCLSLPPLVKKVIEVPMSYEQARLYASMKRDLVATIEDSQGNKKNSVAELAITKALRLQQIVSGHLRVEGENQSETDTIQIKENPRRDALYEILKDVVPHYKVLVWAVFKANYHDIRDVCDYLKIEYAELHGEIKNRDEEIRRFNDDEKCRVLIGHPGSGGIGVNLVAAAYSVFYSRSFSLEFDLQAEARNYRGGSERHASITRIDLVCPETIDEVVLKALASKQAMSDSILKEKLKEI